MDQFWSSIIIAVCAAIPSTIGSIATLIFVIKMKNENKVGNDKIEAKVDEVKKEVNGKHSELIDTIKTIATASINNNPRAGRKTDP